MGLKEKTSFMRKWIRAINFSNPIKTVSQVFSYIRDWRSYSKLDGAERISIEDSYPALFDNCSISSFDTHYTFQSAWALQKVYENRPKFHTDIGSQVQFITMLSVITPAIFLDIRPIETNFPSIRCLSGSVLQLPFADNSIASLSSLHVLEHIGLGRYGDPLNSSGTVQACKELVRVLKPQGNLFVSLPIGKPRLCFNAHRIHSFDQMAQYFSGLKLLEFSAVDDTGKYVSNCSPDFLNAAEYGCGMFWFCK